MINIRKATENDMPELVGLHRQLRNAEFTFDNNLTELENFEERKSKFINALKDNKGILLVALIDAEIVGYIQGYLIDDDVVYQKPVAELDAIVVDTNYRKKGIATKLIKEFDKWCSENDVYEIFLSVFEGNKPAITLYKELGFKDYSIRIAKIR